jgi:hypothetical protein
MPVSQRGFLEDCDCNAMLTAAACFRDPNLNESMRKAINIVLLNSILAGLNGTSVYTKAELLDLGKCCACDISTLDQGAIWSYMLWTLASTVGVTSETAGELIEEACSLNCDPRLIEAITLKLWCLLLSGTTANWEQPT